MRIAAALVVLVGALVGCGATTRTADPSAGAKLAHPNLQPPARVDARRLRPGVAGAHLLRPGTVIPIATTGLRTFFSRNAGFAVGAPRGQVGVLYPLRTSDGGGTWRVAGPALYTQGAHAGISVAQAGAASQRAWFACCGLNTVVDVTPDAGRHWWQAFLPGEVLTVYPVPGACGHLVALVQPFTKSKHPPLWTYESDEGRLWSYEPNPTGPLNVSCH